MAADAMYCGIDVGLKSHAVCVLDREQNPLSRFTIANDKEGFIRVERSISKTTKICIEPTGVYSLNLYLYFFREGYDIRFCETRSSSKFAESIFGKKKHDRLDCVALAKYRIVHESLTFNGQIMLDKLSQDADPYYHQLRSVLLAYRNKSKEHAQIKNKITALVDLRCPEIIRIFPSNRSCRNAINILMHSKEKLLSGEVSIPHLNDIQQILRTSIGQYDIKADQFNALAEEYFSIEQTMKELRKLLSDLLKKRGFDHLIDYCGLHTVNLATILCEVQNVKRFIRYNGDGSMNRKKSLRAFKKFIGLTVTSNQSGQREGGHKLVRSGRHVVRGILFMLAMTYVSIKDVDRYQFRTPYNELNPKKYKLLYEQYCKKTKKMIALTKIMDKIATDLFFVLKDASSREI